MDPLANINEQREIAQRIIAACDARDAAGTDDDGIDIGPDAARLAELVLALDEWRKSGGFDPYA